MLSTSGDYPHITHVVLLVLVTVPQQPAATQQPAAVVFCFLCGPVKPRRQVHVVSICLASKALDMLCVGDVWVFVTAPQPQQPAT
jgi:hypothetical protein